MCPAVALKPPVCLRFQIANSALRKEVLCLSEAEITAAFAEQHRENWSYLGPAPLPDLYILREQDDAGFWGEVHRSMDLREITLEAAACDGPWRICNPRGNVLRQGPGLAAYPEMNPAAAEATAG